MGLAPYGEPKYVQAILDNLIDLKEDGTFRLNMRYFNYCAGLTMTNSRFSQLFGGPPRTAESEITQRDIDIAASIQKVTEEVVLRLAATVNRDTGAENLCMAGGVALNCVSNGRVLREGPYRKLWIQPAAGDAGGALGAAQIGWHEYSGRPRVPAQFDQMRGSYLGPDFSSSDIRAALDAVDAKYSELPDDELFPRVASLLSTENVIGWFQGRMEFGPRALGGRSILGDPRSEKMQSTMNLKIKFRESFRPFAPAVLGERVSEYFAQESESPYMLIVAPVSEEHRLQTTAEQESLSGIDKLNIPRSSLPAITHVDYSARIQTVHADTNPRFHRLIQEFDKLTGCGVLINTSFNVRGEPIVLSPQDAYQCFMRTEMDFLVIENFLLDKKDQPEKAKDDAWMTEFGLD
jgi:carbamoyltransferase